MTRHKTETPDELFLAFRDGADPHALAELFDRLAPTLLRIADRLAGSRTDAEDLLQETFLTALDDAGSFRPTTGVEAWLVGILVNRARAEWRRSARRPDPHRLAAEGHTPRETRPPEEQLGTTEFLALLQRAISELPESLRTSVRGRLLEERTTAELAAQLDISEGSLRVRLHRGLVLLRLRLRPQLSAMATWTLGGVGARLAPTRSKLLGRFAPPATVPTATWAGWQLSGGVVAVVAAMTLLAIFAVDGLLPTPTEGEIAQDDPTMATVSRAPDKGQESPAVVSSLPASTSTLTRQPVGAASTGLTQPESTSHLLVSVSDEDDRPVSGAPLRLERYGGSADETFKTDSSGRVEIAVESGVHQVALHLESTASTIGDEVTLNLDLIPGETRELDLTSRRGVELVGQVLSVDGSPIVGATVEAWLTRRTKGEPDRVTVTDGMGVFRMPSLGDVFTIRASAPGFVSVSELLGKLRAEERPENSVIWLAPATQLRGTVTNHLGELLQGVSLVLDARVPTPAPTPGSTTRFQRGATPRTAQTDYLGGFEVSIAAGVPVTITANREPYLSQRETFDPGTEEAHLVLRQAPTLRGRVKGSDGEPAVGALVTLIGWSRAYRPIASNRTDQDGVFALADTDINGGGFLGYWIAIQQPKHAAKALPAPPRSEWDGHFPTLHLTGGNSIRGHVLDAACTPVPSIGVRAINRERLSIGTGPAALRPTVESLAGCDELTSDSEGGFAFDQLASSEYWLEVFAVGNGKTLLREAHKVGAGPVELVLPGPADGFATVKGFLTDVISGEPITKASVMAAQKRSLQTAILADSGDLRSQDGAFELRHIPLEPCLLRVDAPGYHPLVTQVRRLPEGPHEQNFELAPLRSLDLRIVDASGDPVDRCELRIPDQMAHWVAPESDQEFVWSFDVRDGLWTYSDLLPGPLELTILQGDHEWTFVIDLTQQPDQEQLLVLD